uniref:Uncharacterized protein n=1 Tax=Candidatus Kentrum sp. LPFa TaxID=2126335 RepID=A0A450WIB7_9GAMM|nr:MAG: hypothetical protein BECKLPF1236B_GA0070989_11024 [Candidatus Kentron sp. LPFa]
MKQQPRFWAVGWIATRIHREEEEMVDARSDPPYGPASGLLFHSKTMAYHCGHGRHTDRLAFEQFPIMSISYRPIGASLPPVFWPCWLSALLAMHPHSDRRQNHTY